MVCPKSKRGSSIRIQAQLPSSFVVHTSSSMHETRSVSLTRSSPLSDLVQSDVTPSLIMRRVEAASGAKYSTHNEKPRKFEPIAPVGTNYTPIGKPDIAALRRVPPAPRPVFGAPVPAPVKIAPPHNVPDDDWDDEPAAPPPVPLAASRPPPVPTASRPAPVSVSVWSLYLVLLDHFLASRIHHQLHVPFHRHLHRSHRRISPPSQPRRIVSRQS